MPELMRRLRLASSDERGIAMIIVILIAAILFVLTTIVAARSITDFNRVSGDQRNEQSLFVAEAGMNRTLYKILADQTYNTGEAAPASFASEAAEQAWVIAAAADNSLGTIPEGQWVSVRPANSRIVYSVGYVPTRAAPTDTRIIRAEYDFAKFAGILSVLSHGDVRFSSRPDIFGSHGSVHTNGDLQATGPGSVEGYLSASGSYTVSGAYTIGDPGNSGGGKPVKTIPVLSPREDYFMSEYDLCPSAQVRTGPSYSGPEPRNASGVPCQGTLLGMGTSTGFRGWAHRGISASAGNLWEYNSPTAFDGVYYVYQGSATIKSSTGTEDFPWSVTVFAEATAAGSEPNHCPHVGGDIIVERDPWVRAHDKGFPILFAAGRDVIVATNSLEDEFNLEGVIAAHEQFEVRGMTGIEGSLLSNGYCSSPGSPVPANLISGDATISTEDETDIPFGQKIRITHWSEF